jgi:F420H(2)-dependent quinone reductase
MPNALVDRLWPLLGPLMGQHATIYRATGGRIGHRFPGLPPFLVLEHTGAKSGKQRQTPLLYVEDGDNYVVIASKGGHPRHPSWYHNLRANPDVAIQVGPRQMPARARAAGPEERPRLWRRAVEVYRPYEDYQRRTNREIPVVILEPRQAPA